MRSLVRFQLAPPAPASVGAEKGAFSMWKKALVLAAIAGIAVLAAKKYKDASDERELWHEATTAPDHR
jgi:hypothetical protein